jgi:hypothetical protein
MVQLKAVAGDDPELPLPRMTMKVISTADFRMWMSSRP